MKSSFPGSHWPSPFSHILLLGRNVGGSAERELLNGRITTMHLVRCLTNFSSNFCDSGPWLDDPVGHWLGLGRRRGDFKEKTPGKHTRVAFLKSLKNVFSLENNKHIETGGRSTHQSPRAFSIQLQRNPSSRWMVPVVRLRCYCCLRSDCHYSRKDPMICTYTTPQHPPGTRCCRRQS